MSVLWQKRENNTLYEVRTAGNSRRLYTDGVFHSQYNPNNPITGNVWDLLLLPAFFYEPQELKRVLVLGVGGGAVLQQLNYFLDLDEIVGVELDPMHIYIAENFFNTRQKNIKLVQANAVDWLKEYRGPKFDIIIDDLFGGVQGEPCRAVEADSRWARQCLKNLSANGVLVTNFISNKELKASAYVDDDDIVDNIDAAFVLTHPHYVNNIAVLLRKPATSRELRQRLETIPELNPNRKASRLKYRIRQLT